MEKYKDLVSRADTAWLNDHVGREVIRLLRVLDPQLERATALREIFFSLYEPHEFIGMPEHRRSLFGLLRESEARALAMQLGVDGDPFQALEQAQVARGSNRFRICCRFLDLPDEIVDDSVESPAIEPVDAKYSLFAHQQSSVSKILEELTKMPRRVVLHMPTGAGKTRMAMYVVCQYLVQCPKTLVVWLANNEELCEQSCDEFKIAWAHLGNRQVDLYRFWGQRKLVVDELQDGLLIAGFSKLYSLAIKNIPNLAGIGDKVSLLVVDEAHQAIAPTYELVINGLAARKSSMPVLGLTATPGRTWQDVEQDKKLAEFFGRKKVTLAVPGYSDPIDFLIKEGYLAAPSFKQITPPSETLPSSELLKLEAALEVPYSILKMLAEDERRSLLIVHEVERLLKTHHRVILFATTVKHANILTAVFCVRKIDARCVTGETSEVQRASSIAWFKEVSAGSRVIINYGVLTTGFDAPQTSAALIARPTKSLVLFSQMVGRALRGPKAGGNAAAEIVTVVDTALPGFGDLVSAFNNWEDVW